MKTDLLEWINQSTTAFDILVCKSSELPSGFKILDPDSIDREWHRAFHHQVGAFPVHKAQHALQHIAHRVARRLARSKAQQVDVAINGLRNAWFHPIFAEFATLVPIRHLARKLASQSVEQAYAIPLSTGKFTVLSAWDRNDLEALYLAYELRQRKVPVVLIMEDEATETLEFKLSQRWLPKGYPQILRDKNFTTIMCRRAMSKRAYVREKSSIHKKHKPGIFTAARYFGIDRNPAKLTVKLKAGPSFGSMRSLSAPTDTPSLEQGFDHFMVPLTQKVTQWYRQEFKHRSVSKAVISDHASLEGGLLGAEVVKNGGQLYLWPHSSNLVHMHVYDPKEVARVTIGAQSTGAHWAKTFKDGKVAIDVRSILPETKKGPSFVEGEPLNVILFAGAHALKRMPLIDNEGHKATWVKLLRDLHDSNIELTIKHKSSWETREWITNLAPKDAKLQFTRTHANKLNLPNMVFLSISLTSTAIFEGIARGVPGMTARDVLIEETPYYDPSFVPCITSDKAASFISSLNSKAAYDALREKQKIWFDRETSPSETIAAASY